MGKISFFLLFGAPLRKNRSQGPAYTCLLNVKTHKYSEEILLYGTRIYPNALGI